MNPNVYGTLCSCAIYIRSMVLLSLSERALNVMGPVFGCAQSAATLTTVENHGRPCDGCSVGYYTVWPYGKALHNGQIRRSLLVYKPTCMAK